MSSSASAPARIALAILLLSKLFHYRKQDNQESDFVMKVLPQQLFPGLTPGDDMH